MPAAFEQAACQLGGYMLAARTAHERSRWFIGMAIGDVALGMLLCAVSAGPSRARSRRRAGIGRSSARRPRDFPCRRPVNSSWRPQTRPHSALSHTGQVGRYDAYAVARFSHRLLERSGPFPCALASALVFVAMAVFVEITRRVPEMIMMLARHLLLPDLIAVAVLV